MFDQITKPGITKKLKFIGCEIIHREACKLAAQSPYSVDLEFLPKGLHDLETQEMLSTVQSAADAVKGDKDYQAIILGYARCNDGLVGLRARDLQLVIPRAHDCITFFFGSRGAYHEYFDDHPGTYFHTTGWMERNNPEIEEKQGVMKKMGLGQTYEELVEQYGKENADFIVQTTGGGLEHYDRICYLEMNVTDETPYIEASKKQAQQNGWSFDHRKGDWSLLKKLFFGQWDHENFLIVPPGKSIKGQNNDQVLGLEDQA